MGRSRRNRVRALHKADKAQAAQTEAVFTPEQAVAIAQALASKTPVNGGQVQALPRNPALMQIPFSPGVPLTPSAINSPRPDSGRPEPRSYEFPMTANLPGSNEKLVPWSVLRQAADGISIFRKCIEIRKDEFSSLDWDIVVSRKAVMRELRAAGGSTPRAELEQQMQARLAPEIARISAWWEEPDRRNGLSWIEWIKKLLEERFVLDAAAMYPRRTFGGDLYSLEILDGSTIKPLLDEYGGRPMPPNPAYQQILWGFPRGEFVADLGEDGLPTGVYPADQLIYEVDNVRSWTPYGYSAVERALTDGALEVQRKAWLMATYTDGVMPSGWLRAGEGQADWSTAQLAEMERDLNDYYSGITQNRMRLRILPWGMEPVETADQAEKYKPDLDLYLLKLCAGHFSTTIAELGFTEPGGLGSTGYHEGQADVQDRKATRPTVAYVQALINKLSRRHLGMPLELEIKFAGDETEDDAAEDEMADRQVKGGRLTINEDRDRRGLARFNFPEADMPFVMGGTGGITFMEGSKQAAEQAQQQAAMLADAKANPPAANSSDDEDGPSSGRGGNDDGPKKPTGGPSSGRVDKADDPDGADLIKAEVAAYTRWARKNPAPRRPFYAQHGTPDDFPGADPTHLEFAEWVWEPGDITKAIDVDAWNRANPLHPRGADGKFRKRTLGELVEHLTGKHGADRSKWPARNRRTVESLEAEHGGKAGHDNVERWDAEPPKVHAARARQERVDRARAFAEQLANMEEELADQHDTAEVVRRVRSAADRNSQHEHLAEFASVIEGHQGDREAMLRSARSWAQQHGLTPVGTPGERVVFDPAKHHAPPWMQRDMRDGGMDQPMEIVRPGYRFNDPEGGEEIRLSKPAIDFPEEPAPVKPTPKAKPRKAAESAVTATVSTHEAEARRILSETGFEATDERVREEIDFQERKEREPRVLAGARSPAQQRALLRQNLDAADQRRRAAAREAEAVPSPASEPAPVARPAGSQAAADQARRFLEAATSREEAAQRIDAMLLTAPQLRQLARDLNVPFGSKDTKAKVRDRIIQIHVSTRLDSHAINPGKAPTPEPAPVHRPTAPAPTVHKPGAETLSPAEHRAALEAMTTREEAAAYVARLKGQELEAVAREYSVNYHPTADKRRRAIVEMSVGYRRNQEALARGSGGGYVSESGAPTPAQQRAAARAERLAARSKTAQPKPDDGFQGRVATAGRGEQALQSAPLSFSETGKLSGVPDNWTSARRTAAEDALVEYQGGSYATINHTLRQGIEDEYVQEWVDGIDDALSASRLQHDVAVYRGIRDPSRVFGPAWDDSANSKVGLTWTDGGYTSTSADERVVDQAGFAAGSRGDVRMRIVVPAGTPALRLSDMAPPNYQFSLDDPDEQHQVEAEILLQRGLTFRVVADHGSVNGGPRMLDVEVVPE